MTAHSQLGLNGPTFWITLIVFISICSQLFQRGH